MSEPAAPAWPPSPARTSALTVLSPIRPGWTWLARAVLDVFPRTPPGSGAELQELRFIQSARWSVVRDLPTGDPARPTVRPRYDYLFFESNFNGTLDSYLQAFADVLHLKMRLIWNSAYGFPNLPGDEALPVWRRITRPIPGRAFVDYVRGASLPADHFYSAYPQATTTEVLAGLAAEAAVADLRGRVLAGHDPASFDAAYTAALLALQPRPMVGAQPDSVVGDVRGGLYAFTALTPVRPGAVTELRATLAALGTGAQSPFAAVPGVHFARWVVIDELPTQPGQQRDGWPQAYLLTSTTADGSTPPYADLHRSLGAARDAVYGLCAGYPQAPTEAGFAAYLQQCRIPAGRFYAGYPDASVGAVLSGLDTHARLVRFAHRHGRLDATQRLAAFRATFCPDGHEE